MKIDAKGAIAGRIEIDLRHGNLPFDSVCLMARRGSAGTLVYSWILAVDCLGKGGGSFRGPIYVMST